MPSDELGARYDVPREVLDRLAELGAAPTPDEEGVVSPSDVRIVEAISRFRAGGYDESLGFTVYDTLRYKGALEGRSPRRSGFCVSASPETLSLIERWRSSRPESAPERADGALHTKSWSPSWSATPRGLCR